MLETFIPGATNDHLFLEQVHVVDLAELNDCRCADFLLEIESRDGDVGTAVLWREHRRVDRERGTADERDLTAAAELAMCLERNALPQIELLSVDAEIQIHLATTKWIC